ncbi:MAG TPA: LysE family transporter [Thermotogota bacterium]|nr:LysE family transporter [Thermotogota bacterium]
MFNWTGFLPYVFVVLFTPGPNNILCMAVAGKKGFRGTLPLISGTSTGFFLVMLLSGFFNMGLFELLPGIERVMGFFGAAFMLFLAWKVVKGTGKPSEEPEKSPETKLRNPVIFGFLLQFLNAKVILFGLTLFSTFITPVFPSLLALLLFSIFLGVAGMLANISWALFGSLFGSFLSRYQKAFNIVVVLLLLYAAFSISGIANFLKG